MKLKFTTVIKLVLAKVIPCSEIRNRNYLIWTLAVPYSSTKQKQLCFFLFCLCFVGFVIYVPTSCRQKQISIHIQQRGNNIQYCSWYSLCEDDNSLIEHPIVEVFDEEGYSNGWWSVDFDTESGVRIIYVTVFPPKLKFRFVGDRLFLWTLQNWFHFFNCFVTL